MSDKSSSPGPEHIFKQLETQILQLSENISSLEKINDFMKNALFDDEDRKVITQKLSETIHVKKGLEKTLEEKQDIYKNHICVMEKQLDSRQCALEKFDTSTQFFRQFLIIKPSLSQFF